MHPFIWVVYPAHSDQAMIATGATDDEGKARGLVECVLKISDAHAYGWVISPSGFHDVCRRGAAGRWDWRSLFEEEKPYTGPLPGQAAAEAASGG